MKNDKIMGIEFLRFNHAGFYIVEKPQIIIFIRTM